MGQGLFYAPPFKHEEAPPARPERRQGAYSLGERLLQGGLERRGAGHVPACRRDAVECGRDVSGMLGGGPCGERAAGGLSREGDSAAGGGGDKCGGHGVIVHGGVPLRAVFGSGCQPSRFCYAIYAESMSDIYAFDLALDLRAESSQEVLDLVQWHLGLDSEQVPGGDLSDDSNLDAFPLWSGRGAAHRIGGVLLGGLVHGTRGWALTVRQEIHSEDLPELKELVEQLARHSVSDGLIGQIRFHESELPDVLFNRSGTLVQFSLIQREEVEVLAD